MSKTLLIFFFVFSISVKTNAEVVKPQKKQNFRIRLNNSITENDTKLLENEIVFGRGIASKLLGKYELLKD